MADLVVTYDVESDMYVSELFTVPGAIGQGDTPRAAALDVVYAASELMACDYVE